MSNRDVLEAATPRIKEVSVGDQKVLIRSLSGAGRTKYFELHKAAPEGVGLSSAQMAALAMCEPDGSLSFNPEDPSDIAFLEGRDGQIVEKIALEFLELSGLTAKSAETAEKN